MNSRDQVVDYWWSQRHLRDSLVLTIEETQPDLFEVLSYKGSGSYYLKFSAHPLPIELAREVTATILYGGPPRGFAHIFDPGWEPLWR